MRRFPKGAALVALLGVLLWPRPALAVTAFDILIPKPAEFFPALIAFIVIFVVLAKFIWPSVLKTLDSRQQTIQDNIDESEKTKLDAQKALRKSEATIQEAQARADGIIAEAKKAAEATKAEIIDDARKEASELTARTRAALAAEREATMDELTEQVADISVDLASKIIGESLDEDAQKRIIERYLAKAGDIDES